MKERIETIINQIFPELVEIRRDFHQYPELGLQEFRTAEAIEGYLKNWSIDVLGRIRETSVVGEVLGQPDVTTIALRADMDALPITEKNDVAYISRTDGIMHACGHDVHMTILLGTAYVLHELRAAWSGQVKLLFQQAEETVGGAQTMIDAGVLDAPHPVSHVLGLHVCPKLEVGTFGIKYDHAYAASDTIALTIAGHEAHGAAPQDGLDSIVIASQIINNLQTLVSRNVSPLDSAVLSFGMISGGSAHNVLAGSVTLRGTLRTLNPDTRTYLKKRIFEMAHYTAKAYGGSVTLTIEPGYDALINDEKTTALVEEVAKEALGEENVIILDQPSLGVEDFAYFAQASPSTFNRLGVANQSKGITAPLHDSRFDVDEAAIKHGVMIQTLSALKLLAQEEDES